MFMLMQEKITWWACWALVGPAFPLLGPFPVINVRYKLRQQPILPTVKFSIWAAAHKPNALRHRGREAASARDIFLFKEIFSFRDIFFFNDIFVFTDILVFKDISFCKSMLHQGCFIFKIFPTACIFDFKEIFFSKDVFSNRSLKGDPCQSKNIKTARAQKSDFGDWSTLISIKVASKIF